MDHEKLFALGRFKFWVNDHVRFSDLDPLGHVNNNSIGQYFENARAALYVNFTPRWPYGDSILVLARSSIDFVSELHYPAQLRVGSGVKKIGRTSLTVVNALFRGDDGIAASESISVLIDAKTRKPVEFSAELRAAIEPFVCDPESL